MDRTVADLMSKNVVTISPTEPLDIGRSLMTSCQFRHLPVVAEDRLVGVLSLRDLLSAGLPRRLAQLTEIDTRLRSVLVGTVMHKRVTTARPNLSTPRAIALILEQRISCLPVTEASKLIGIVTKTDFLGSAIARLRARTDRPCVRHFMTPTPTTTLKPTDGLDLAHALMKSGRIHHLPVVDGERIVGMLSDHDLIACLGAPRLDATPAQRLQRKSEILVADAMSTRVVCTTPDELAVDAAEALFRRRLGSMPVARAQRLVGMLSISDFFYDLVVSTEATAAPEAR